MKHYFTCRCALDLTSHSVLVYLHAVCLHQLVLIGKQQSLFCATCLVLSTWDCVGIALGLRDYRRSNTPTLGCCDADYAGDIETRTSTTDYVFILHNAATYLLVSFAAHCRHVHIRGRIHGSRRCPWPHAKKRD